MKYILLASLLLACRCYSFGDDRSSAGLAKIADNIKKEGLMLYRLESSSWYGTDVFMANFHGVVEDIGGYFSYPDMEATKCIFYSKDEKPKVIGTVSFSSEIDANKGVFDPLERAFNKVEEEYYLLRKKTADLTKSDTSFKTYKNTQFNLVAYLNGNTRRMYVLTSTSLQGVILYGNDYQVDFDNNNNIVSFKPLHLSLLPMEYGADTTQKGAIHSHVLDYTPYITPTDICITMLYEHLTGWSKLTTVSEKFVSIWTGESLIILDKSKVAADDKK